MLTSISNLTRIFLKSPKICLLRIKLNNMNRKSSYTSQEAPNSLVTRNYYNLKQLAPVNGGKYTVLASPIQSESDKKEYKVILLENGLTACLISDISGITNEDNLDDDDDDTSSNQSSETESEKDDESLNSVVENSQIFISSDNEDSDNARPTKSYHPTKMAAAALCVGVGSFSDPKDFAGMAHFLEHMVFMGSEKFPEENDFDAFISKRGGSDNAATDLEITNFHFECLDKHLHEALDKFAQFFIAPLMNRGSMTREREVIESEFQMALTSDVYRKEQLLCSFAKQDSPVNNFAWGNLKSLRDNVSDDVLYEKLHEFRKRHYSAHRMTLAVQARLPIEVLESIVLNCFSKVPNNNLPPDDFSAFAKDVFIEEKFSKIYYVKPSSNITQVDLTWALPSLLDKYRAKPHQYLSWILGDESKGSLLSYLRKKVWVLNMTTGNGESGSEHNSLYAFFSVSMSLTDAGLEHFVEVIECVFSYLNMLRQLGPNERIFDEIKLIDDTSFRFSIEENALDVVEDLVENMQLYPPEHYIIGSELYFEYDADLIKMVLSHLIPRKMNVLVLSNKLPPELIFTKTEEWFDTPYVDQKISEEYLKIWENAKPRPEFSLPPSNPFLTDDFSILPEITDNPAYPVKIINTNLLELWYRKDDKFKLPLAHFQFYLINPIGLQSPTSLVKMDMLLNLLGIQLVEDAYPGAVAELNYSINISDKGISLKVHGYNQKLPILIELITNYLKNMDHLLTEEIFNAVKDKLLQHYHNSVLKPDALAKDIRLQILVDKFHGLLNKHDAIAAISFKDIQQFSREFISQLYVKSLVQGNVTKELAVQVVNKFVKTLNYKQLPPKSYPHFNIKKIPVGITCCKIENCHKNDTNTVVANYYQVGPFSVKNSAIVEIITVMLYEPLFDALRTKEQLGYHVNCQLRDTYGILGFTIKVVSQATKFTADFVDERIEEFIRSATRMLNRMSKSEFNEIKRDLIKKKQCLDVHLKEEVDRNWAEIIEDDYMFDRLNREVKALDEITLQDVRRLWTHSTVRKSRKKLSVRVVGFDTTDSKTMVSEQGPTEQLRMKFLSNGNNKNEYFISDINDFCKTLQLYPKANTNNVI